jgi:signal transduction histidine kinase
MQVVDSLRKIRLSWISKLSNRLARGEGIRSSFQAQLNSFYDLMIQAVETGDAEWLNGVLDEWAQARPENASGGFESILPLILQEALLQTHEILEEEVAGMDALTIEGALLPVFTHAFRYAAVKEARIHIDALQAKLDEALLSSAKLDKSKSDFISIATHELKTPLTLIEGYAAMLKEQSSTGSGPLQSDILLKGIHNGTRRLKEIIDDMVDVSMIDNDLLTLNFQPVWIGHLLDVVKSEYREPLSERKLKLNVKSFPGSREMTFGDNERLFQALRNVIANAVKFTPDGGQITVDGRILPGFIEITITDTGIGIDPEDHIRIFEKFSRLENSALHSSGKTKFMGGGPGLGLPIAKGIIEAHGGAIWVESPGRDETHCPGAMFHILLPLQKSPPDKKIARLFSASIDAEKLKELI